MTTRATAARPTGRPISDWRVEDLLLDDENPRLPPSQGKRSQEELMVLIVRTYSVSELMESFVVNGYFDEEPLVGVPINDDPSRLIIVEGNRRLAALKLLLQPDLAARLVDSVSRRPLRVRVPRLPNARRRELETVPVRVYPEGRSAVLAYLGYRHITGVRHWDSYAKARYVYQLVQEGGDLKAIQKRIGDRHETASRLLRAYLVWEQADSLSMIPPRNGYVPPFSYLFTALTYKPTLTFLGLAPQGMPRRVPKAKIPQLREVATYLYGDKSAGRAPAIEESREIQSLAKALASENALEKLRTGANVREAVEAIPVKEAQLERTVRQALERLVQAGNLALESRSSDPVRRMAKDCVSASEQLVRALR